MIQLINWKEKEKWNEIVSEFKNADTYFKCQYSVSFMENEDGTPYLVYYESNGVKVCYPIIEKDIASFSAFKKKLPAGQYFDWNTPYGYGGPISNVEILSEDNQEEFKKELYELATSRNVVSQFIRFHPLLQNQTVCSNSIENEYVKDTIYINLDTTDDLMVQMDTKNRNLIRKAIKNNVIIQHDGGEHIEEFMKIYSETMDRDNARDFYYFPESYYNFMKKNMSDETEYFYAYQNALLMAAQEVKNAVTAVKKEYEKNSALQKSVNNMQKVLSSMKIKYKEGLVEFSDLLLAEQHLLSAQNNLAASRGAVYQHIVSFYKSVGGGYCAFNPRK